MVTQRMADGSVVTGGSNSLVIKPAEEGGHAAVARLSSHTDLGWYARAVADRDAAIPAGVMEQPVSRQQAEESIPLPLNPPPRFVVEPFVDTERCVVAATRLQRFFTWSPRPSVPSLLGLLTQTCVEGRGKLDELFQELPELPVLGQRVMSMIGGDKSLIGLLACIFMKGRGRNIQMGASGRGGLWGAVCGW